ncbi:hypothetical protein M3Y95_00857900 [Aphelenchoides besseyi]|nr:hypothetical protein M3Y95_00857900 [Aphelenchoides besseyi]
MSVLPQINESSAKVEEVDQLVKLAKFEDETKSNASLVLNDKVRLRASFEDGGSVLCVVVSSLENAEVVFQQKMSEAQFKQHPGISETKIPFRSAVSTIHGFIKQSTAKNSSFRMELKVRLKKNGKTVAIFEFKGKVETAGFFDQYATSLAFELEELKSDALCRYLAQRLLKLEKANERRDTKYNDVKKKYFDLKDECKVLTEVLDQTQRDESMLRQKEEAYMAKIAQLERECDRLKEELEDETMAHEDLKSDHDQLKSNYDQLKSNYDHLKSKYDQLKSDYEPREIKYRLLSAKYLKKRQRIEALENEIVEIKEKWFAPNELDALKIDQLIVETERNELREEKKQWSAKMKKLQDEVSEWKQKYTDARSDVDEWKLLASARLRQIEGRSTGCFSPTDSICFTDSSRSTTPESICFTDSSRSTTTESICFTPTDSSRSL